MSERNLDPDSSAVQTHLQIMQDVIRRMAENSRSCKVWCVTLVSATLVLVTQTGHPQNALLALVPAALFFILDTYYLALERSFRNAFDSFVNRLHKDDLAITDLFDIKRSGAIPKLFFQCLLSFSIWPFYLMVGAMVILARATIAS